MRDGMLGDNKVLHDLWCGPLFDFVQKVNGKDGEKYVWALKRLLRDEKVVLPTFPIWRTINPTPGGCGREWFRKELAKNDVFVAPGADVLLRHANFTWERVSVNLVRVKLTQLGFDGEASRQEIYERAKLFGLGICSKDVGPLLRLQYLKQSLGESLIVGSEPVFDVPEVKYLFEVSQGCNINEKPALSVTDWNPHTRYAPDTVWIFVWR